MTWWLGSQAAGQMRNLVAVSIEMVGSFSNVGGGGRGGARRRAGEQAPGRFVVLDAF